MTRRAMAMTGLAALVVIGLVGTFALIRPPGRQTRAAASSPEPSPSASHPVPDHPVFGRDGTLYTSDDPNFGAAQQRVERALTTVPTLPGAVRLDRAPVDRLQQPSSYVDTGNLIDRATFWRASSTVPGAVGWFRAHPTPGLSCCSTGLSNTEADLTFGWTTPGRGQPCIQITVVADAGGVAIRVDAMEVWNPTKPVWAYIGAVDSVEVMVLRPWPGPVNTRPAAPTVRRTLTGAAAQRLADAVDALQVATSGARSCPPDFGFFDRLTVHTVAGRTVNVRVSASGCPFVTVTAKGATTLLYGSIDDQITKELGLPPNYGR